MRPDFLISLASDCASDCAMLPLSTASGKFNHNTHGRNFENPELFKKIQTF